jgi:hypothetical protein
MHIVYTFICPVNLLLFQVYITALSFSHHLSRRPLHKLKPVAASNRHSSPFSPTAATSSDTHITPAAAIATDMPPSASTSRHRPPASTPYDRPPSHSQAQTSSTAASLPAPGSHSNGSGSEVSKKRKTSGDIRPSHAAHVPTLAATATAAMGGPVPVPVKKEKRNGSGGAASTEGSQPNTSQDGERKKKNKKKKKRKSSGVVEGAEGVEGERGPSVARPATTGTSAEHVAATHISPTSEAAPQAIPVLATPAAASSSKSLPTPSVMLTNSFPSSLTSTANNTSVNLKRKSRDETPQPSAHRSTADRLEKGKRSLMGELVAEKTKLMEAEKKRREFEDEVKLLSARVGELEGRLQRQKELSQAEAEARDLVSLTLLMQSGECN